ncbi:hypothetical protein C6988_05675 [Nitrosopumilus sp. b1]|uniref:hypothetical protein n=1 Tax=Nitrosopumilus sp. b1 TaxID=2109907 RepID=UPI0015F386EB|nr:hypothetical protein [Nitrosopumilus sp. b1]KAF6242682.1 hypothetical protein C6988_05675 [Nitrosopumilus sp. b1]
MKPKAIQKEKTSHLVTPMLFGIMFASIVAYFVIFATPITSELPVQITEEVKIIAVTEKGIVVETSTGVTVVTDQYVGSPGDIIEVTYSVPMKYLENKRILEEKYTLFQPKS